MQDFVDVIPGGTLKLDTHRHSSSRVTKTLLVLMYDFHFNMNPFFVGMRPQIGFGKKFGKLDFQVQLGADFEVQSMPHLGFLSDYHLSCSGPCRYLVKQHSYA